MMGPILLCLDSGTTAIKAAAFDGNGQLLACVERPNGALRRNGIRVEQDMDQSRDEAWAVLRDCAAQVTGPIAGCIITAQGDGVWPIDADGKSLGLAMTWLDGRARNLVSELAPALDRVQAITGSRPTAASASLQMLWLQRHEPERFAKFGHALRLKEWLFLSLTGKIMAEPSAVLPVWGSWRDGLPSSHIEAEIGLTRGIDNLPDLFAIGACQAGLDAGAAAATGLPIGLPVLLGPGDVQATLIGLGLGSRAGVTKASIFGTSSIHACLRDDPDDMADIPAGAMVQQFALGDGYLCFHPCFNGATLLHHLAGQFSNLPISVLPSYSNLVIHPFFEPGGERAPWTNPHAQGAIFGQSSATTPAQIAWAGREALAFVAHKSHKMMGADQGALSLGGGLAGDAHFAGFLAHVLGCEVQRNKGGHAGLRGLAALGAKFLLQSSGADMATHWLGQPDDRHLPETAKITAYAQTKYDLFERLVTATAPFWADLSALRGQAETMIEATP